MRAAVSWVEDAEQRLREAAAQSRSQAERVAALEREVSELSRRNHDGTGGGEECAAAAATLMEMRKFRGWAAERAARIVQLESRAAAADHAAAEARREAGVMRHQAEAALGEAARLRAKLASADAALKVANNRILKLHYAAKAARAGGAEQAPARVSFG